jgi:hypothetical protein
MGARAKGNSMSTAMILRSPLAIEVQRATHGPTLSSTPSVRAPLRPLVARADATYVFGDSTPFPHDSDVIATIRHTVGASVALMRAHHAGLGAIDRGRAAERERTETRAELAALGDTVRHALASARSPSSIERTAARILVAARAAIEADAARADVDAGGAVRSSQEALDKARTDAIAAVAAFAAKHDLPGTRIDMRLVAENGAYEIDAIVTTPYGLRAAFRCEPGAWRELRRVRTLGDVTITLPREVGVFAKRMSMRKVKLGRLVLLGASIEEGRGALLLGESEDAGVSHEIEVDDARVLAREAEGEPHVLAPEDAARVVRLFRALAGALRPLAATRGAMSDATVDARAITSAEPATIADKMIRAIAPMTREIARRSGAPGELVLRKNVGAGRRDEVYVTAAELLEPIRTLPPAMRSVFAPLALDDAPRSPRAPAPSMPSYEELHESDLEPLHERDTPTLTAP